MFQLVVAFAVTQTTSLQQQLELGYRRFDLRIADTQQFYNDTFFWHHSITGDAIFEGMSASFRSTEVRLFSRNTPMILRYM